MKTSLLVPLMFIAFLFAFGLSVHIDRRTAPTSALTLQANTTAAAAHIMIHYPAIAEAATSCNCPEMNCRASLGSGTYTVAACSASCSSDEPDAYCRCGCSPSSYCGCGSR